MEKVLRGSEIRSIRESKGISQKFLADKINIKAPNLSKIEKGDRVGYKARLHLTNYLFSEYPELKKHFKENDMFEYPTPSWIGME